MKEEIIKNLSGYSGCKILLCRNDKNIFVKKVSASVEYNSRLKKQFIKQKRFKIENVSTPQIYNYGIYNGLFFFDMEYVRSQTFSEKVPTISTFEVKQYIEMLFSSLPISQGIIKKSTHNIFINKIKSLDEQNKEKTDIEKKAFSLCLKKDYSKIPITPCHGDLTLENIMITENKRLYLIDFLDSFCNSYYFDVAKLLQDIELKWSYRNKPKDTNREIRLLIAKEMLINHFRMLPNGQEILRDIYYVLLINLLRILPYTTDELTKKFLQNAIYNTINVIEQEIL